MLILCLVFWLLGLGLQAACEPKMLRFARLPDLTLPPSVRWGRFIFPLLGLVIVFWTNPVVAIFVWAGTFSVAAVIVAIVWASLTRVLESRR